MARASGELPQPAGCILAGSVKGALPDAADSFGMILAWKVYEFDGWPGASVNIG